MPPAVLGSAYARPSGACLTQPQYTAFVLRRNSLTTGSAFRYRIALAHLRVLCVKDEGPMFADDFMPELRSDPAKVKSVVGLLAGGRQFVGHLPPATRDTDL